MLTKLCEFYLNSSYLIAMTWAFFGFLLYFVFYSGNTENKGSIIWKSAGFSLLMTFAVVIFCLLVVLLGAMLDGK